MAQRPVYDDSYHHLYSSGEIFQDIYEPFTLDGSTFYRHVFSDSVIFCFPRKTLLKKFLQLHKFPNHKTKVDNSFIWGWSILVSKEATTPTPPPYIFRHPDDITRLDEAWFSSLPTQRLGEKIALQEQLRQRLSRDPHVDLTTKEIHLVRIYDLHHSQKIVAPIMSIQTILPLEIILPNTNATTLPIKLRQNFLPRLYKPLDDGNKHFDNSYDDYSDNRLRIQPVFGFHNTPSILERLVRTRRLELFGLFIFAGLLFYLYNVAPLALIIY